MQPPPGLKIDGDCLVITSLVALPERCVRTNEPVSPREYRSWNLAFIPQWIVVMMFIAPFFLFFGPFFARNRCNFKAGLSIRVWRLYFLKKILVVGLIVGAPLTIPAALLYDPETFGLPALVFGYFGCLAGFLIMNLYSSPLKVVDYCDGWFWIRGCSREFLDSLEES